MTSDKKVYVVTVDDCEITDIKSIHATMEGALDAWNCARLELLQNCREMIEFCDKDRGIGREMYVRMICNLENTNPDTISNYPHECPHITEYNLYE